MKRFGVVTENTCEFEVSYLTGGKRSSLPKDANAFYELYVKDDAGNLINVPVLVTNFRDAFDNEPNKEMDYESSRLVHRFFISDTISGIDSLGGYNNEAVPAVIRYAKSAKLRVQINPGSNGKIRRPLLQLDFEERFTSQINRDTKTQVTYFVDYYQDMTAVYSTLIALFVITNLIALIAIVVRICYHYKHNPPKVMGTKFTQNIVTHSLFYVIDEWSYYTFWFCFFVCGYWFLMYKMSNSAVLLLPSTEEVNSFYDKFEVVFYMVLAFRTAAMLFRII